MSEQEIFAAAIAMSPDNRAALAQQLLATLDEDDTPRGETALDPSWGPEIAARLRSLASGEVTAMDGPEAMRLIREAVGKVRPRSEG